MNLNDLLSGDVISSIARSTGNTQKDTTNVLANALPALVSAMANNASTKDGADSLARALDRHTTGDSLASLLGNVDTEDGAKILTNILGGNNAKVQSAVAKQCGITKGATADILSTAAPLLLSALGSQKKATKTGADGLTDLLTGLLGGGSSKSNSTGTLLSLAGALLGGGNKSNSSADLLRSLTGSLLGSTVTEAAPAKKTAAAKKTATAKKAATTKKTTTAKKTTSKKSSSSEERILETLADLLTGK